jgi:hypothetical protein
MLKSEFEVSTAVNGYEAVELVRSKPIDYFSAVILDLNMPIMDGYRACTLLFDYFNANNHRLPSERPFIERDRDAHISKTLLFCVSSDCSPETS